MPDALDASSQPLRVADLGQVYLAPPTFLERWGVIFVAWVGFWILAVSTALIAYFIVKHPQPPVLAGLTADQSRDVLAAQKLVEDQWRESLTYVFDLTVTKTALPIATLLLGYLFGRGKAVA